MPTLSFCIACSYLTTLGKNQKEKKITGYFNHFFPFKLLDQNVYFPARDSQYDPTIYNSSFQLYSM